MFPINDNLKTQSSPNTKNYFKLTRSGLFELFRNSSEDADETNRMAMSNALREYFSTLSAIIATKSFQISSSSISVKCRNRVKINMLQIVQPQT